MRGFQTFDHCGRFPPNTRKANGQCRVRRAEISAGYGTNCRSPQVVSDMEIPHFTGFFSMARGLLRRFCGVAVSGLSELYHAACSGRGVGRTGRHKIADDAQTVVFARNRLWSGFAPANRQSLNAASRDGAGHGLYERTANIA
jgi:hypothetical protein